MGKCWGLNTYGNLGRGNTADRNTPGSVSGGHVWETITTGATHTCGLDSDGLRYCWGNNSGHELGILDDNTGRLVPTFVDDGGPWLSMQSGFFTTCGIAPSTNRLYCFGRNDYGQAGRGDRIPHDDVHRVNSWSWSTVSVGGGHTCGVRTNGTAYCWGHNEAGELGLGNTADQLIPAAVSSQSPLWTAVTAGGNHTCGIRDNANLYCWGYNKQGQLGIGTTTSARSPVLVP